MFSLDHAVEIRNPAELSVTYFESKTKPAGQRIAMTWPAICDWIEHQAPTAAAKGDLPLIKLATFANDHRTDAGLEMIYGVEGDYDGEAIQPADAVALLQAAGITALVYTSPSHSQPAPRWRILCPLSRAHAPDERRALVGQLNAVLGGVLAVESFTPSQAYYVGSVTGGHPVQCWRCNGRALDTVEGLQSVGPALQSMNTREGRQFKTGEGQRAPDYKIALDGLHSRHPSYFERSAWLAISGAFFTATNGLAGAENAERDWQTWNEGHGDQNDPSANARTWRDFQRNGSDFDFKTLGRMSANANAAGWAFFNGKAYSMPAPPRNFFIRVADMVYRPPEYLIATLIETDTMSLLFGDPAAGKSFVAIDLACSVATGADFHGNAVKSGAVFYIAGEGRNGLKRRFSAWEEHRGVSLANANIFTSDGAAAQFLDAASAQMVAASVDALVAVNGMPRLIVVDTLARNFGPGNENSQENMGQFIATLDGLKNRYPGCVILIVHHSGHSEKERSRGSSVLKGALDCEFKIINRDGEITLENTKMKDGPTPKPMLFKLETVGFSAALEYQGEPNGEKRGLSPFQQLALDTFNSFDRDVVSVEDWRTAFYARHDGTDDAKRKTFKNASTVLVERQHLTLADDGREYHKFKLPGLIDR